MAQTHLSSPRRRPASVVLLLLALLVVATLWTVLLDWRGGNSSGVPFVPQETVR
jgi:hypothetical protein